MNYYFLDIETNSNSLEFNKDEQEIIQIGIYNSESKTKFNRNINIGKPLSENIKRLTGISDDDLKNGVGLKTALNDALDFLGNKEETIIVGHNLEDFDLYILGKNDSRFLDYKYVDTLHLFLFLFPGFSSYTVQELYKRFINSDYTEKHQALQDSIDEFELFNKVVNKNFLVNYYSKNGKDITFVKNLLRKYNGGLNGLCYDFSLLNSIFSSIEFDDYLGNKYKMLKKWFYNYEEQDLKENKSKKDIHEGPFDNFVNKISNKEMEEVYQSFIKNTNSSFRDSQYQMCQHIKDIFNKENHNLFIEAGTGTGKTYSYLLPAIEYIRKNKGREKKKIYVSTYTKVLQNQIMEKDVPFLNTHYPDIKFELLKATSEGIALDNVPFKGPLSFRDLALWNRLYWGNFYSSDIHFSLQLKIGTNKLLSYAPGNIENQKLDTQFGFRGKLKSQYIHGDIFVVNHAFINSQSINFIKNRFTGGLKSKGDFFVPLIADSYFIADEGHNLESVTREFLTLDYTKNQFDKVLSVFNSESNFNLITYINRKINKDTLDLENLLEKKRNIATEIDNINKHINKYDNLVYSSINSENPGLKELTEKLNNLEEEKLKNNTEILEKKNDIKILEQIKIIFSNRIFSDKVNNLFRIYDKFVNDFKSTNFCEMAIKDILNLRIQGYDTSKTEYDKDTFNSVYLSEWFINFLSYSYQIIKKLYDEISELTGISEEFIEGFVDYFAKGINLISNNCLTNYFFTSIVELSDIGTELKNFGFKGLPIDLSKLVSYFNSSEGNIVLSATLFDKLEESYVLREVFGNSYNFSKIKKYPTPFNYKEQRKIYCIRDSDLSIKENKMHEFIKKYGGRTLILTTTLAQKRKLANICRDLYEKAGIMVLMHKSGTLATTTNQKNVQSLRNNPNTILVGSKSYAEGVDVPGDNLKLVIIDKLPFLPPTPFIKYKDKQRVNKGYRYVYNFLCSIDFRQSIGRLIRTSFDTGDILILDERLLSQSGQFFRDYLEGENIFEI